MVRWYVRVFLLVLIGLGLGFTACGTEPDDPNDEIVIVGRNDDVPEIEGPYTEEELRKFLDNFSWFDAPLVEEYYANEEPLFYYVEVLVNEEELNAIFRENSLPWDVLPLFDEELEAIGIGVHEVEVIDIAGLEEGQLIFTILPGEIVNLIIDAERSAEEEGEEVVGFLRLREVPKAYRTDRNTVKPEIFYEAFDFYPDITHQESARTEFADSSEIRQQTARFRLIPKIVRGVRKVVQKIGRGISRGAGKIRVTRRDVTIKLSLHEWKSWDTAHGAVPLQRAWGRKAGKRLLPERVLVGVNSGVLARTDGRLKSDGTLTLRTPKGVIKAVTIDLKNHAADITRLGFNTRVLRIEIYGGRKGDQVINLMDIHPDVLALAVFTDAYDYTVSTFGVTPKVPYVATLRSKLLNNTLYSSVPAVSLLNSALMRRDYVNVTTGALTSVLLPADIIIDRDSEGDLVVLYHEYGHWVLANILAGKHQKNMTHVWGGAALTTLPKALRRYAPDEAAFIMRMINEGFADFFAIQTVGIANYGKNLHARTGQALVTCNFTQDYRCYEDNVGSSDVFYYSNNSIRAEKGAISFPQELSWELLGPPLGKENIVRRGTAVISTFLTDMVDGGNEPNLTAGALWIHHEDGRKELRDEPWRFHMRDESVALTGREVKEALELWISRLDSDQFIDYTYDVLLHDTFAEAFGEVARRRHSQTDVCLVFALHSPHRSCPQLGASAAYSWLELLAPQNGQVFAAQSFRGDSPIILISWSRLIRRGDRPVVRLYRGPNLIDEYIGNKFPMHIFGQDLEFDTSYIVELATKRLQQESVPEMYPVRTLAERPHSLITEWLDNWTVEVRWMSTASEYEVLLKDPESGRESSYFTTEPFLTLGYFDMPFFEGGVTATNMRTIAALYAQEDPDEMSAIITIRAYNADGESIVSTESVSVTMGRDAIPGN